MNSLYKDRAEGRQGGFKGWLFLVALLIMAIASPLFVADSWDGSDWQPKETTYWNRRPSVRTASNSRGARWLRRGLTRLAKKFGNSVGRGSGSKELEAAVSVSSQCQGPSDSGVGGESCAFSDWRLCRLISK